MRRILPFALIAACTGGGDPATTDTGDGVVATQFGDEGPVDCMEGDAVPLDPDEVPAGFTDTVAVLFAERSGRFGDGTVELDISAELAQASWREGLPTDSAPAGTVCPGSLSLVTEAELVSDALDIPVTELWIHVAEDGGTTARWSSLVYVEPPDTTDDEPGGETVELSDWTIDPSLEPTDFVIDDMGTTEAALWMAWDSADLGTVDVDLIWFGVDGEGSYEQTTASWTLSR